MFKQPKTLEEARDYRYNKWAGNPNGRKYVEGNCAAEIHVHRLFYQCSRKNGHGCNGLYCKQHAKKMGNQ